MSIFSKVTRALSSWPARASASTYDEGAQREGALRALQAVRGGRRVVAVHEAVGDQLAVHGLERRVPHRVRGRDEADVGHPQQRRVEDVGAVVLDERLPLGAPAPLHDLVVDRVPFLAPAVHRGGPAVAGRQADAAVEGDPAHQPAVGEVLSAAAGLPDALLGLVPVVGEPVEQVAPAEPAGVAGLDAVLVREVDAVDRLAVDVELELVRRAVADADGTGPAVALPVLEDLLGQVAGAVDPVHDLQRGLPVRAPVLYAVTQPAGEGGRLLPEAQAEQGVHGEGRVPDPGVAVVPVAFAADLLGQPGRRCGHQAAGRGVGHELEGDGGAVNRLAPAAEVGGLRHPGLPEAHGLVEELLDLGHPHLPAPRWPPSRGRCRGPCPP